MFVELGVFDVFGAGLADVADKDVLVLLEQGLARGVLETEVFDDVELDWGVGRLKYVHYGVLN